MVKAVKAAGANVKLTEYPGVKYDSWIARKLLLAERSRNPGWAEYMGEKGECLMHVAINDYTGQRRVLLRTTIAGSRPAAAGG